MKVRVDDWRWRRSSALFEEETSDEEKGEEGRKKGSEKREVRPLREDLIVRALRLDRGALFLFGCQLAVDPIESGFRRRTCRFFKRAFAEIKEQRKAERNADRQDS